MDEIKKNVAANITANRKRLNMTQLQLAEMLNYTDKAVSKWERGEAVPDVFVLKKMADIFGITVDELISSPAEGIEEPQEQRKLTRGSKALIAVISAGLVWLVATVVFVALLWAGVNKAWLSFVYALPLSAIVFTVFGRIWEKKWRTAIAASVLIWSMALAVHLTLLAFREANLWLVFIVCIPLQILTVLWFVLRIKLRKDKD